ncbi:hypothetical protein KVV02_004746 [Mortierella alpina]|uniref:Neurochondrin-domain-containing protein n=1 Tax=Mortierella alpina TaxID=64518 RepID=A0A9P8CYA7_MORAP|nr:hypothetical protein KVV02_004746 [Mortierella alpina]
MTESESGANVASSVQANAQLSEQDTTESALERCLELLRPGTSDESKFIGLTLMSELLQDTQGSAIMTRFFDSMDFGFLDRMMHSEESTVPKDAGVDTAAIKSIAVDIMTCFSTNWELLIRNEFKERVPSMLNLLQSSDDTDRSKKILQIMLRISAYPQVSMVLTNPGYQSKIVSYILETFDRKDEAHEDAVMITKRTFLIIQEGFKQNPKVVLQITQDFLPTIMSKISQQFSTLTESHKPEILRLLSDSLGYLSESYVQQHTKEHAAETKVWTRNLKSGLIQLLSTRQAPTTRDDSFKLIGILLQRLGPEWIFPDRSATAATANTSLKKKKASPASVVNSMAALSLTDAEIDKKFAGLIVHLTCVEVRVLMDELANELSGSSSTTTTSTPAANDMDAEQQSKVRKEQVLPLTYEILEVSIGYLVHLSESEDLMENGLFDAMGLLKLQESLQATFASVLDYLKDLQSSKDATPESLSANLVYLASLRILSAWLMEDDSLHGQAASIAPTLEAVVKYCASKSSKKSLLRLLQPILDRFHEIALD